MKARGGAEQQRRVGAAVDHQAQAVAVAAAGGPELDPEPPLGTRVGVAWNFTPDLATMVASLRRFAEPSIDGRRLAFERLRGNRLELRAIGTDGSRLRRRAGDAESWTGSWSPDAERHALRSRSNARPPAARSG